MSDGLRLTAELTVIEKVNLTHFKLSHLSRHMLLHYTRLRKQEPQKLLSISLVKLEHNIKKSNLKRHLQCNKYCICY